MRILLCFMVLAVAVSGDRAMPAETGDLNTQLVLSTVKLSHPDSTGTAFIMTRPSLAPQGRVQFVLVTAGHVLERIKGDEATLHLRKQEPDGRRSKARGTLKVRQGGTPLWTKHPTLDVAAIRVSLPPEVAVPGIPVELLASDEDLQKYEIHPGDMVRGIGFPHANQLEASPVGFPLVRMGCVASYPLLPTKETKTFFIDFNGFEGDSGAPVYLSETNRFYGGKTQEGRVQLILGLLSGQQFLNEQFKLIYSTGQTRHRLGLGIVVHATAIRETIALLSAAP